MPSRLVVFGMIALVSGASAQRPDLSGVWTASIDAPSGIVAAPSPVMGQQFGLRFVDDTLVVARPVAGRTVEATLTLDGTKSRTFVAARSCDGDQQIVETAVWEGDALALTRVGVVPAGGGSERQLAAKLLIRRGEADTVVVEGTMQRPGGAGPAQVATVYRRSADGLPPAPPSLPVEPARATIADVSWIAGTWSGLNGTVTVEERWTPPASGSMLATGRLLRGSTQTSYEFLCIVERNGGLVYKALPDGRTDPTDFVLTDMSASSATFRNPIHDFPQVIRYARRDDGSLETTISATDGSRARSFVLQRER